MNFWKKDYLFSLVNSIIDVKFYFFNPFWSSQINALKNELSFGTDKVENLRGFGKDFAGFVQGNLAFQKTLFGVKIFKYSIRVQN